MVVSAVAIDAADDASGYVFRAAKSPDRGEHERWGETGLGCDGGTRGLPGAV
jgi:hypothetical protein